MTPARRTFLYSKNGKPVIGTGTFREDAGLYVALDSAVTKWKRNLGKRFDAPSSKRTTVEKRLLRICSTRLLDNVFKFNHVAKDADELNVENILDRFEEENFEDLANVFHVNQSDLGTVADGEWEKRNATVTMMSDEIASLLDSALPSFFSSLKEDGERSYLEKKYDAIAADRSQGTHALTWLYKAVRELPLRETIEARLEEDLVNLKCVDLSQGDIPDVLAELKELIGKVVTVSELIQLHYHDTVRRANDADGAETR